MPEQQKTISITLEEAYSALAFGSYELTEKLCVHNPEAFEKNGNVTGEVSSVGVNLVRSWLIKHHPLLKQLGAEEVGNTVKHMMKKEPIDYKAIRDLESQKDGAIQTLKNTGMPDSIEIPVPKNKMDMYGLNGIQGAFHNRR